MKIKIRNFILTFRFLFDQRMTFKLYSLSISISCNSKFTISNAITFCGLLYSNSKTNLFYISDKVNDIYFDDFPDVQINIAKNCVCS